MSKNLKRKPKSLEAVFVHTPDNEVYSKLQTLLLHGDNTVDPAYLKGIRCTKKAYSLFETRGKTLFAEKRLEEFRTLLLALRYYATPTVKSFKNFHGFGLPKMMTWLNEVMTLPLPHPSLNDLLCDFISTIEVVADYSEQMKKSLYLLIPVLLKLASDHYKSVTVRYEVVSLLNEMIQSCSIPEKRKFLEEGIVKESLMYMGANLHNSGDYELQVSILEILSRCTNVKERQNLGPRWFDRINLTDQYLHIREEYFDIDCRYFLNNLNKAFSVDQSVYSIQCTSVKVGPSPLSKPTDINDFWIDFNTLSKCVSFFIEDASATEDEQSWKTIYIKRDEVQHWNITNPGRNQWQLDITLHAPLPDHESSDVFILFSTNPRLPLSKSIGEDKEINHLSSSVSVPSCPKASVAMVPVRVTLSPNQHMGNDNPDCTLSTVSPDPHLTDLIFQFSSQGSMVPSSLPKAVTPPLQPKTPNTSTPKQPLNPTSNSKLPPKSSHSRQSVLDIKGPTHSMDRCPPTSSISKCHTLKLKESAPSLAVPSKSIPTAKTASLKKISSMSMDTVPTSSKTAKLINNSHKSASTSPDSIDFSISNKRTMSNSKQATSNTTNTKRSSKTTKPVKSSISSNSLTLFTTEIFPQSNHSSIDTTFDFPESPKKSKAVARSRKRKQNEKDTSNSMPQPLDKATPACREHSSKTRRTSLFREESHVNKSSHLNESNTIIDSQNHTHIDETMLVNETHEAAAFEESMNRKSCSLNKEKRVSSGSHLKSKNVNSKRMESNKGQLIRAESNEGQPIRAESIQDPPVTKRVELTKGQPVTTKKAEPVKNPPNNRTEPNKNQPKKAEYSKDPPTNNKKGKSSKDRMKKAETSKDHSKRVESSKDQSKRVESSKDQSKRVESSKDQSKRVESGNDQLRMVESGKDQSKRVESSNSLSIMEKTESSKTNINEPQMGTEALSATENDSFDLSSMREEENPDNYDVDNEDHSLMSFHSSQVEPDIAIVNEFEQIRKSVIDQSSIRGIPTNARKRSSSISHIQEEEEAGSPSKRSCLIESLPTPLTRPSIRIPANNRESHCNDIIDKEPSVHEMRESVNNNINQEKDDGRDGVITRADNRGFLYAFERELVQQVTKADGNIEKSEEHYETAFKAIESMQNDTSATNNLLSQIRDMYETLFINLDTMNKQDYKRSQQQRLTIMEELKQQMMKQAHDREMQQTRKKLQSWLICCHLEHML